MKLALNDNQNNFIELYLQGLNPTEISKQMHISRTMIYKYLKNDEIKSELNRRLTQIKNQANEKLNSKVNTYLDELEHIAFNAESEKVKADILQYLVDRTLGKTTTKIESNANDKESNSVVDLDNELQGLDNVVDFEKVKAK